MFLFRKKCHKVDGLLKPHFAMQVCLLMQPSCLESGVSFLLNFQIPLSLPFTLLLHSLETAQALLSGSPKWISAEIASQRLISFEIPKYTPQLLPK